MCSYQRKPYLIEKQEANIVAKSSAEAQYHAMAATTWGLT